MSSVHFEELGCSVKGFRQVGGVERKGDMKGIYSNQALVSLSPVLNSHTADMHIDPGEEFRETEIEFSSDSSSLTSGKF